MLTCKDLRVVLRKFVIPTCVTEVGKPRPVGWPPNLGNKILSTQGHVHSFMDSQWLLSCYINSMSRNDKDHRAWRPTVFAILSFAGNVPTSTV